MNADFHYYATYVAARFAGHSSNESITIARAAQYVDESSASLIKSELLGVNPGFTPTPTIESFERLAKKNLFTSKSELDDTRIIWTSFHFAVLKSTVASIVPADCQAECNISR